MREESERFFFIPHPSSFIPGVVCRPIWREDISLSEGWPVSTFYVLPPRAWLGERLAGLLQTCFPGLSWNAEQVADLAAVFAEHVEDGGRPRDHTDFYVVHREDLPVGEALDYALADGFGAEPGDEVVEVRPGSRPGETATRRWKISPGTRAGLPPDS